MNRAEIKKKKIFDLYSKNLKWIKEKTNAKFKVDFENGVLCPLCLEVFTEESLNVSPKNHLTLEHNPPESLGGKANILTCKECNNKSGHKTDSALFTYIKELEFNHFRPNSEQRVKVTSETGSKINADFKVDEHGIITINLQKKYSNPSDFENFLASEEKGFFHIEGETEKFATKKIKFDIELPSKGDERLAKISLLKIGYLLGFEKYGHIFLFNNNLKKIREQILNPDKEILKGQFMISYVFPEMYIGANIINKPDELHCFLNTFILKTNSKNIQVSIAFPGYYEKDENLYDRINNNYLKNETGTIDFEITTLQHLLNLRDENKVFLPLHIWKS